MKIEKFKDKEFNFYNSDVYTNRKDENILVFCTTKTIFIIDLIKREIKAELHYSDIVDINYYTNPDRIKFKLKEENNEVRNLLFKILILFICRKTQRHYISEREL